VPTSKSFSLIITLIFGNTTNKIIGVTKTQLILQKRYLYGFYIPEYQVYRNKNAENNSNRLKFKNL